MTMKAMLLSLILLGSIAASPATQPGASSLEIRAATEFNNGQYALALPLLQRLSDQLSAQSDKKALIAEQIRVCKAQLATVTPNPTLALPTPPQTAETRKPHAPPKPNEVRNPESKSWGTSITMPTKGATSPPTSKPWAA